MRMKLWIAARAGGMRACMAMLYSGGCERITSLVEIRGNQGYKRC